MPEWGRKKPEAYGFQTSPLLSFSPENRMLPVSSGTAEGGCLLFQIYKLKDVGI